MQELKINSSEKIDISDDIDEYIKSISKPQQGKDK